MGLFLQIYFAGGISNASVSRGIAVPPPLSFLCFPSVLSVRIHSAALHSRSLTQPLQKHYTAMYSIHTPGFDVEWFAGDTAQPRLWICIPACQLCFPNPIMHFCNPSRLIPAYIWGSWMTHTLSLVTMLLSNSDLNPDCAGNVAVYNQEE